MSSVCLLKLMGWLDLHGGAVSAIATIVIAMFTIVLACVTGRQAKLTRELVKATENTAKRQLRAYVSGDIAEMAIVRAEHPATVKITLKNHGNTPANKLLHKCEIAVLPNLLPPDFDFPYSYDSVRKIPFVLFPGQDHEYTQTRSSQLTPDELTKLEGNFSLYIYGMIEYWDVFGEPATTKYCVFVPGSQINRVRKKIADGGNPEGVTWVRNDRYNEAS